MARRRTQNHIPAGPVGEFIGGFIVGSTVVSGELVIFAFSILMDALSKVAHSLPTTSQSFPIDSYFSLITLILIIGGFLQHFLLSIVKSEAFSVGFIVGDLLLIILLGPVVFTISPPIVTGMITAILIVFIGFCLRIFNRPQLKDDFFY